MVPVLMKASVRIMVNLLQMGMGEATAIVRMRFNITMVTTRSHAHYLIGCCESECPFNNITSRSDGGVSATQIKLMWFAHNDKLTTLRVNWTRPSSGNNIYIAT